MKYTHKDYQLIGEGYTSNPTSYALASRILGYETQSWADIRRAQKIIFKNLSKTERKKIYK